mgnify:CR=1 FL=1
MSGYIAPQQPIQPQPPLQPVYQEEKGLTVFGIVGVVFGALGFVLSFIPIINNIAAIFGFIGVILAIVALVGTFRGKKRGKALAIVAAVLSVLAIVITLAMQSAASKAIAEAREKGDLKENAEYDAAKERQGFIEGRIREVESKLSNAQIIDPKLLDADGRCVFGATVELEDLDTGDMVTYQIVGDDEADIKDGKIAISSPIARALIGKFAGDVAEVQAPGGVRELELIDVRYV